MAYQEQQGPDILRPQTRGMQGGNFQNTKIDGMTMFVTVANAMEQFQQIEVVNGVSASLYGPANPSGMFNFVTKRPTDYDLREVTRNLQQRQHRHRPRWTSAAASTERHLQLPPQCALRQRRRLRRRQSPAPRAGRSGHRHPPVGAHRAGAELQRLLAERQGLPGLVHLPEKISCRRRRIRSASAYGQSYAGVDLRTRSPTRASSRTWLQLASGRRHPEPGRLERNINTAGQQPDSNAGDYTSSFANGFAPRFVITSDAAYLNGISTPGASAMI